MSFPTVTDLGYTDNGHRVYDYAQNLLNIVNQAAAELSLTLPSLQYVTSGEPVADCEQVVVTGISVATGMPAGEPVALGLPVAPGCSPMWSVNLEVGIVRCGPKVLRDGSSTPDELNSSFRSCSTDIAILLAAVEILVLGENLGKVIASIAMGPPEGGMVTTALRVTAVLP